MREGLGKREACHSLSYRRCREDVRRTYRLMHGMRRATTGSTSIVTGLPCCLLTLLGYRPQLLQHAKLIELSPMLDGFPI
jgi:hypothetical protein